MIKVCIMGDIHGVYTTLNQAPKNTDLIVQIGDFGYTHLHSPLTYIFDYPIYFISGNHDSIDQLKYLSRNETEIGKFNNKLWYIPRGWVELIGDTLVGFLGGAETPAPFRASFVPGLTLFADEGIKELDLRRLEDNLNTWNRVYKPKAYRELDVLITHSPPISILRKMAYLKMITEVNETNSAEFVEQAILTFKPKKSFFGNMHRSFDDTIGNTKVIGLNTNEMFLEEW